METTFAAKPDGITFFKEHCCVSKEKTEKTMIPPALAQLKCASALYELVTLTRPVYAMLHTCAMLDPVQNTVPSPAMLHTRAKMDPVLDTVPDPATLHTLAKVPTMEDLHSFSCLTPKEH